MLIIYPPANLGPEPIINVTSRQLIFIITGVVLITGANAVRQWSTDGREAKRTASPLSGLQGALL